MVDSYVVLANFRESLPVWIGSNGQYLQPYKPMIQWFSLDHMTRSPGVLGNIIITCDVPPSTKTLEKGGRNSNINIIDNE